MEAFMEAVSGLRYGFGVVLTPWNILFCFFGSLLGTLVGVLPGLGPCGTIAMLFPITLLIPPSSTIIMLASIYYGAQYGASTTSILVNIPGEVTSVITCLDGHQMAKQGRAGPALGIAAIGSFLAANFSICALAFLAPPLAKFSLKLGPPEICTLMTAALFLIVFLSGKSVVKGLVMGAFGFFLGSIGMDTFTGIPRFTFNIRHYSDGLGLVPVVMGLFGITEVLKNIYQMKATPIFEGRIKNLLPSREDLKRSAMPILRGSFIGFILGLIPGGGLTIGTFTSYAVEKKLSKTPEAFGTGVIEGVASPESSNNAGSIGAFVPMLTMGLPFNPVIAVLLGALIMRGVQPGPLLVTEHPDVFWGVISSMYIGNAFLVILNLPLIPLWLNVLKIPYKYLFPMIILFCMIGVYSINYSAQDVYTMIFFGILGFLFDKLDFPIIPLILAMILAPMYEDTLRQSLILSDGSFAIFFTRPICLFAIIVLSIFLIVFLLIPGVRDWTEKNIQEEE